MALWAKYSTQWYLDPRVLELTRDAELLYARAIAYCKEQLTDGAVARGVVSHLGAKLDDPEGCAQELLDVGLWQREGRSYTFPPATWVKWQGTKADVEQRRVDDAERKRTYRSQRRHAVVPVMSQPDTNGTGASRIGGRDAQPEPEPEPEPEISLSVPTRVQEGARQPSAEREINDHDLDRTVAELGDRMRLPEEP